MRTLIAFAIAIGAFIGAPMFIVVPMSFSDSQSFAFRRRAIGWGTTRRISATNRGTVPTINSTIIAFATMIVTMALVIPASFAIVRFRFYGPEPGEFPADAPLMVPHIVLALAYYSFFGPIGLINTHLAVVMEMSRSLLKM